MKTFATNTVKNCLYIASKVENEKSNTVNRCGMLLRIIMSSFIPIRQVMTEPQGFFKERRPLTTRTRRLAAFGDQFLVQQFLGLVQKALIMTNKRLMKGIKQASPLNQASCLEGFHSVLNHFDDPLLLPRNVYKVYNLLNLSTYM